MPERSAHRWRQSVTSASKFPWPQEKGMAGGSFPILSVDLSLFVGTHPLRPALGIRGRLDWSSAGHESESRGLRAPLADFLAARVERGAGVDGSPRIGAALPLLSGTLTRTFPHRRALSAPGTSWPCWRREGRILSGTIPGKPGHGPRGRLNAGAAVAGGSEFDALEGPVPRRRRFTARILGAWSPESRAQQKAPDLSRRSARTSKSKWNLRHLIGRMEWRVDGSKHRLDRPPSSCRSLPIQQARFREQGLWGTLTILSLFAGTVMASPQTLRAASGSLGSASSASMEKNNMETPSLAAWNHRNGKNITMRDLSASEFLRAERSPSRSGNARKNFRRSANGPCRKHSRSVLVRNLGLGYETDEVVSLNYCSGSCTQTNYDVVLSYIMQNGILGPRNRNFLSQPCCRPILYENFSFLDTYNVWQTVHEGSAAQCGCVG